MKRLVPVLVIVAGLVGGALFFHRLDRYAEAQGMADAPHDGGAAAATAAPTAVPVTSDIATAPAPVPESEPAAAPAEAPTAPAAPATKPPPADAGGFFNDIARAVRAGDWRMVAAAGLGLIMLGLARVRNHPKSPFRGDRGGAVLVLLLALGGGVVTVLYSGVTLTPMIVLGALGTAAMSVGGFTIVKRIIWPADKAT